MIHPTQRHMSSTILMLYTMSIAYTIRLVVFLVRCVRSVKPDHSNRPASYGFVAAAWCLTISFQGMFHLLFGNPFTSIDSQIRGDHSIIGTSWTYLWLLVVIGALSNGTFVLCLLYRREINLFDGTLLFVGTLVLLYAAFVFHPTV